MSKVGSLEIEIRAGIARLQEDFNKAKAEVNASMNAIQRDIQEHMAMVKENFTQIREVAEAAGILFLAEQFAEAGKEAAEFGEKVTQAAQKTGMSLASIQGLGFAAKSVGSDFDSIVTGTEHLSRSMIEAQQGSLQVASAFQSVGLSANQLKGMKMEDVLKIVADKFHDTRDGAEKTAIAMQLFGRAGAELIPLLDKGSAGMAELTKKAQDMGIIMSDQAVQKSAELADQLNVISAKSEASGRAMIGDLMPAITLVTDEFTKGSAQGSVLHDVMQALAGAIEGILTAAEALKLGFETIFEWLITEFKMVVEVAEGSGKAIYDAIHGNFHQAAEDIKASLHQSGQYFDQFVDKIATESRQTGESLKKMWGLATEAPEHKESEGATGSGKLHVTPTTQQSKMGEYQSRLQEAKIYYQSTNDLREYSKAMEIKYWQDVLDNEKVSQKDRLAIQKQISSLRLEEMKKEASDRQKLSEESISFSREKALNEVALDEEKANTLLKSGQITNDQLLKMKQVYENEKFQIEVQAQQQRIQLLQGDPNHDPVALQKQLDQLAQIQQKHAIDIQKMQTEAAQNTAKAWQDAMKPITSAFDTTMKGIIMGTTTWQKGMSNILSSVVGEFINAGVKMVTDWVANEAAKTAATIAGTQARTAAEQGASAASLATSATTVIKSIMNSAAETFAGIFGFLSPVMGPMAAAPAAAGMGSVAAVAGSIASSAGGEWSVPQDRLQMVHKNETILPDWAADSWRNMVSENANTGGGAGSAVHIYGNENSTFSRQQLLDMLKGMNRDFILHPS